MFPIANGVIPAERREMLLEEFEHVEHAEVGEGIYAKSLALAEEPKHKIAAREGK